jgi:hypothetical protein
MSYMSEPSGRVLSRRIRNRSRSPWRHVKDRIATAQLSLLAGVVALTLACQETGSGDPEAAAPGAPDGFADLEPPAYEEPVPEPAEPAEPEASDEPLAEAEANESESGQACGPQPVDPASAQAAWAALVADAVSPMRKPDFVRGIYLNAWASGSARRRASLMQLADETEVNSFVLDAKDNTGYVSYHSAVAMVREIGAHCDLRIRNIREVLAELRDRGIYPIARIVVFQDPVLAEARPDLAIRHVDGGVWRDHHGQLWVDPYNQEVWDYHIDLAREAISLGFAEIQWDYVRFPDVPRDYMRNAIYPAQAGRSRTDAIREFLLYSREKLGDLNAPITADVFGLTVSASDDMGIGQRWDSLVDATDVLLPMVYPSHFARGSYGIAHPNARPYEVVRRAMEYAVQRSRDVPGAASIRPYLQDFSLGSPPYRAAEVRAQILGARDAGVEEWILWNASSRYTAAALTSQADRLLDDLPGPQIEVVPLGRPVEPRRPDGS